MKKILSVFLLLATLLSLTALTACAGDDAAKAKVIEIELTQEEYAFGVDKDQPELLEKVNAFIKKIMDDGTFDDICNHYFGDGEPVAVQSAELDTSKDQLVVATNAAFEPFEYKKGENYYGIDMEIAALLAKELNLELVISNMDFDAVCLSVGQHKADIAMAGLTIKEDRKEHVTFSDPYYQASQKIIVKDGDTTFDNCKTADDVLKKLQAMDSNTKIGYQNGTTGKMYVENEDDYASNNLKVTGKGYKNGSLAVQDLLNGNVNYVIIDAAPAECIVKALNGEN
ncbi:MAG: transporter substrate-binding domain-containing protein [Clostridia bacterium]|nr:transporter substrate-binding domain-containing protein [Clostridia bacterium]